MDNINPSHLIRIAGSIEDPHVNWERGIEFVLETLMSFGFHSIRYYEAVSDSLSGNKRNFVLTHQRDFRDDRHNNIGLCIPMANTTIFSSGSLDSGFAVGSYAQASDRQRQGWAEPLRLNDMHWIDLGVKVDGAVAGLLAVAWYGSERLLGEEAVDALRLIASMVGVLYRRSVRGNGNANLLEEMAKVWRTKEDSDAQHAADLCEQILHLIPADVCSVFIYDWVRFSVRKIAERPSDRFPHLKMLPEEYGVGEFLTGRAFQKEEFRFIPFFPELSKASPNHLAEASYAHHRAGLGEIKSAMYAVAGNHSNRLLIRIFRGEKSDHVFTDRDHKLLSLISTEIGRARDDNLLERQRRTGFDAAVNGLQGSSETPPMLRIIKRELEQLSVTSYLCIHTMAETESANVASGVGIFQDAQRFLGANVADTWAVARALPLNSGVSEISLPQLHSEVFRHLSQNLERHAIKKLIIIAIPHQSGNSFILIPDSAAMGSPIRKRLGQTEIGYIESLLSILGASVEASTSLISAKTADDLLANIGHELNTPIAALGQKAISACYNCLTAIDEIAGAIPPGLAALRVIEGYKSQINGAIVEIDHKGALLNQLMDVPRIMSEYYGSGAIELNIEPIYWKEIIDECWKSAKDWAHAVSSYYDNSGRVAFGSVKIETNEALETMQGMGDVALIKIALTNLLKNAIKFSLPRYRNTPMTINVYAQPQKGWSIIQVRNWGIGIRKESQEDIFKKYFRVERVDARRSIAGRGLGLFLARSVIAAQGGSLFCVKSESTLDDPRRKSEMEGFETMFELRLPNTIEGGRRRVKI